MKKTISLNNLDTLENLCAEFRRHAFAMELVLNAACENKDGIGPLGKYLDLLSELVDLLQSTSDDLGVLFRCIVKGIDIAQSETACAVSELSECSG